MPRDVIPDGDGQPGADAHMGIAVSIQSPVRKRGRPRKAVAALMPKKRMPSGAFLSETRQETVAGEARNTVIPMNDLPPSSSNKIGGSTAVAEVMGHGVNGAQTGVAHPSALHSQIPLLEGGGGHFICEVQGNAASPNPMPSRKRGRPRKAVGVSIPVVGVPTGALNTETQQETAAGGGQWISDIHHSPASPSTSEIGSNAVADGMGQACFDIHRPEAHPSAPHLETPAQEPVGGCYGYRDAPREDASPSSHTAACVSDVDSGGEVRATDSVLPNVPLPDLAPIVNALIMNQKKRIFCIRSQNRQNNATLAFVRMYLGWSPDLGEKEQKKILDRAQSIVTSVEKGKPLSAEDQPIGDACSLLILSSVAARKPLDEMRKGIEKNMEKLVKQLPVWSWATDVKGFGAVGLAVVIGEAGDLSNYSNPGKLWKRMGLAPFRGKSARTWRVEGGLTADDWTWFGYKPSRRSEMWNRAPSLIKQQISKVLDADGEDTGARIATGTYGEAYLNRKKYELDRNPEISKIHAHNRAQRYMEKRLLKHLWQAWRRQPISDVHVDSQDAA